MSHRTRYAWAVLSLLVFISLLSNVYLIYVALKLQQQLEAASITAGLALDSATRQLRAVETGEFTLMVPIDEQIPVNTTIQFDEEFIVPVEIDLPIDTTVMVPLNLGAIGTYNLDIPIRTTVPIDIDIPVRIKKDVPFKATVPVELDVPITLTVRDTPVADQLAEWRTILSDLRKNLP